MAEDVRQLVGDNVRRLRVAAGLPQEELANRLPVVGMLASILLHRGLASTTVKGGKINEISAAGASTFDHPQNMIR
jgi:hypothetical protein